MEAKDDPSTGAHGRRDTTPGGGDPVPGGQVPDSQVPGDPAGGWDRSASACLIALVVGALASLPWLAHGVFDPKNDACMYVLLARGLVSGEGYSLLGEPFALRPPGFAALIAPLLAGFGTDFGILNLFVNLFGVLCVGLLFVLARPRIGSALALVASALVWLNPGFRTSCNQIMSDVPGIGLALACLVLHQGGQRASHAAPWRSFALGALVGAAALVRTMNLLLLPAFLAVEVLGARRGRATRSLLLLLGATAVLGPWMLRNARTEFPAPTEQTSIYSYSTGMFHADASDPGSARLAWSEVAGRVPLQVGQIAETLGSRFTDAGGPFASPPGPASALGLVFAGCLLLAALRRRAALELFACLLLGVVALYFAFVDRLVLPIFVLGLPAVVEVARVSLSRVLPAAGASRRLVTAGLVGVMVLDLRGLPDPAPLAEREQRMRAVARSVDEQLPAGAPLAARLGWELGVYLEERRVYSLYVVARRAQRAGMLELLGRHGVDHCLFHQPTRDDRTLRKALQGAFRKAAELDDWWLVERR